MAYSIPCILVFHILNCTSTLDTSHGKTTRICEAADNSCLPLEGTLQRLIKFSRLVQVDNVDISVGRSHNQEFILHIQRINSLLALHCSNRS